MSDEIRPAVTVVNACEICRCEPQTPRSAIGAACEKLLCNGYHPILCEGCRGKFKPGEVPVEWGARKDMGTAEQASCNQFEKDTGCNLIFARSTCPACAPKGEDK
jgi:hypothetical protein